MKSSCSLCNLTLVLFVAFLFATSKANGSDDFVNSVKYGGVEVSVNKAAIVRGKKLQPSSSFFVRLKFTNLRTTPLHLNLLYSAGIEGAYLADDSTTSNHTFSVEATLVSESAAVQRVELPIGVRCEIQSKGTFELLLLLDCQKMPNVEKIGLKFLPPRQKRQFSWGEEQLPPQAAEWDITKVEGLGLELRKSKSAASLSEKAKP